MLYVDTSAFLKLVVAEEHSRQLRTALSATACWASTLLDVEAHRAARRLGISAEAVTSALDAITLVELADQTLVSARSIGPEDLRTLDAIHLAAALELGDDLDAVVTYDRRLARAAADLGIAVLSPGLDTAWWD
jgi:predicted nucleic acid-binding protein